MRLPSNSALRHRSEKRKMRLKASQKALRKNFSIYLAKVNTDVSKGHQRPNLAKQQIPTTFPRICAILSEVIIG